MRTAVKCLISFLVAAAVFFYFYYWQRHSKKGAAGRQEQQNYRKLRLPLYTLLYGPGLALAMFIVSAYIKQSQQLEGHGVGVICLIFGLSMMLTALLPHRLYEDGIVVINPLGGGNSGFIYWVDLEIEKRLNNNTVLLYDRDKQRFIKLRHRVSDRQQVDELLQQHLPCPQPAKEQA